MKFLKPSSVSVNAIFSNKNDLRSLCDFVLEGELCNLLLFNISTARWIMGTRKLGVTWYESLRRRIKT